MDAVEFLSSESLVRGYFFPGVHRNSVDTVLFLQGFPGMEGDELICEALAHEGWHVLTFNYRGTFRSQGLFSFSNAIADVDAALHFVQDPAFQRKTRVEPGRIVLGGWSFGSGIVPAVAARHPELDHFFMISGRDFNREADRINQDLAYAETVTRNLETVRVPNGPVRFSDDLLQDLVRNKDLFNLQKLSPLLKERSMLLIGGWDDEVSTIEDQILPIYRSLAADHAGRVRIEALQDDHEFSKSRDRLVEIIAGWLRNEQANPAAN